MIKIARSVRLFAGVVFLGSSASGQEVPDRVILFIIDGLAVKAPERIEMPHYNALKQEGVYYEAMHLPLPGHPDKGEEYPWGCSLPNPMLMSGTPFVGERRHSREHDSEVICSRGSGLHRECTFVSRCQWWVWHLHLQA